MEENEMSKQTLGKQILAKQILVMTGSPRIQGNSDLLADSFIKGATAAGHKADKFISAQFRINGCQGCEGCWSRKGLPCVQNDDFNTKLAPLLEKADVLVLCMPLYAFTFPAQIKAPLDRLLPYGADNRKKSLKIRESALIICGADSKEDTFHAAIESYKRLMGYFKWKSLAELIVPGVNGRGDVLNTDGSLRAEALGKKI